MVFWPPESALLQDVALGALPAAPAPVWLDTQHCPSTQGDRRAVPLGSDSETASRQRACRVSQDSPLSSLDFKESLSFVARHPVSPVPIFSPILSFFELFQQEGKPGPCYPLLTGWSTWSPVPPAPLVGEQVLVIPAEVGLPAPGMTSAATTGWMLSV